MPDVPADPLFLDPDLDWQPVSPKLITERRLPWLGCAALGVFFAVVALTAGAGDTTMAVAFWALAAASVAMFALAWLVIVPRVSSTWRYAERDQDLLVRRGRVYRRLTVVPYGRMQVIEVTANPVSRKLGIATVTLVTASASTDARIPGVPEDTAHQLRDRLAARGEASAAGL